MIMSDGELVARWADGDGTAAHVLLERYFEPLARFFVTKVPRGHDDLIQRTLLRALEHRDQLGASHSFRAYLFTIARNLVIDQYRLGKAHERTISPSRDSIVAHDPTPSAALVAMEQRTQLLAALRELPFDLQVIVELRYWERLTGPELAEVLGIAEGTVRSRLRRAVELLRENLESPGPGLLEHLRSSVPSLDAWSQRTRHLADVSDATEPPRQSSRRS